LAVLEEHQVLVRIVQQLAAAMERLVMLMEVQVAREAVAI
jgi:hypothetical protein